MFHRVLHAASDFIDSSIIPRFLFIRVPWWLGVRDDPPACRAKAADGVDLWQCFHLVQIDFPDTLEVREIAVNRESRFGLEEEFRRAAHLLRTMNDLRLGIAAEAPAKA